jgi:tetratricopeptide (TPR) repeat protein
LKLQKIQENNVPELSKYKPELKRMNLLFAAMLKKTLEGSRLISEKMFMLLKFFAAISLFSIVIFVVLNAIQERDSITVKPFAVPQDMLSKHKAAGSIIANIVKQELEIEGAKIDSAIDSDDDRFFQKKLIANSQSPFKEANIKLPETGISINDIVDFIASIFGRKTLIGTVYKDSNTIYLQVEMNGDIYTEEELLPDAGNASLHIPTVKKMAKRLQKRILRLTEDKYRLHYLCIEGDTQGKNEYKTSTHQRLANYCYSFYQERSPEKQAALLSKLQKINLAKATPLEGYIIPHLMNKIQAPMKVAASGSVVQKQTTSLTQQIERMLKGNTPKTPIAAASPARVVIDDPIDAVVVETPAAMVEPSPPPTEEEKEAEEELSNSNIAKLIKTCATSPTSNTIQSNNLERDANQFYANKDFQAAEELFKASILANCSNPFAWANLGILLSDPANTKNFNPFDGSVALREATQIRDDLGWMWHSLCVANAFRQKDNFEHAINNEYCQQARLVEPGKQIIYDKLFNIAIAERYVQMKKHKKAFGKYTEAINIDPKRTCRLINDIVTPMHAIKDKSGLSNPQGVICKALDNTYPAAEPDEACENALEEYQKENKC